jgi:hypothetical protein
MPKRSRNQVELCQFLSMNSNLHIWNNMSLSKILTAA